MYCFFLFRPAAHGVTTYSLHPGAIITELSRHLKDDSVLGWLWAAGEYVTFVFQKDVAHGAATQICCAVDPAFGAVSGRYYRYAHTRFNHLQDGFSEGFN